jgi:hypothetical protein
MAKQLTRYTLTVEECDVEDRESLRQYRMKQEEWLNLMNADANSVVKQLQEVLWAFNVFNSINETRRAEFEAGSNSSALNSVIADFIDRAFVLGMATGIRKLWERGNSNDDKQIVSLRRVLDDVKDHAHLISRENYVCHNGLPFDNVASHQRFQPTNLENPDELQATAEYRRLDTQGPNAFYMASLMHKSFDKISNFDPISANRDRKDRINSNIFDCLTTHVNDSGIEKLKTFTDKVLVHAGDRKSRDVAYAKVGKITISGFKDCIKALYEASAFLGSNILGDSHPGGFATAQFNVFEKLEYPWCAEERQKIASEAWEAFANEVSNWDSFRDKYCSPPGLTKEA